MKEALGLFYNLPEDVLSTLQSEFDVHNIFELKDNAEFYKNTAPQLKYLLTLSNLPVTTEFLDRCPNLKMISNIGVGLDHFDVEDIKSRGIQLTNTPDVLNDCMADMAMGLLLAVSRKIVMSDKFIRKDKWTSLFTPIMGTRVTGKNIGILGLGRIGKEIAKRAEGFRMNIAYHGRNEQKDQPYRYIAKLKDLALWCDYLMVAAPGGHETHQMVNKDIIEAVGPNGFIINVARGSIIDEPALTKALSQGKLAGAGLDVFPSEPAVTHELKVLENTVLTPHRGPASVETIQEMLTLAMANLFAAKNGKELLTPVE